MILFVVLFEETWLWYELLQINMDPQNHTALGECISFWATPPPTTPPAGSFEGSFSSCLLSPWVAQSPIAGLQITELSRLASRTPTPRAPLVASFQPFATRGKGALGVRARIRPMDFRTRRCGFCLEITPLFFWGGGGRLQKSILFHPSPKIPISKKTPQIGDCNIGRVLLVRSRELTKNP